MEQDYSNLQKMVQMQQQPHQQMPNKPKGNAGCILIIAAFLLIAGAGLAAYFLIQHGSIKGITESFSGNDENDKKVSKKSSMNGTFMDAVLVPGENGKNNIWVLTAKNKTRSSGYILYTYIYNPYENKIISEYETEQPSYPSNTKLFFINNEIWRVNNDGTGIEAGVFVYDAESGNEKMNTQKFINNFSELQSGISKMYVYDKPPKLDIETKDGRKFSYILESQKLYKNYTDYRNEFKNNDEKISIFALGIEKSGEDARKTLFIVTGPKSSLWNKDVQESYFSNPSTLKFITKSEAKPLIKDKVFLEGIMLYQDDDCCLIFHQSQAGNDAERLLSCVDREGNILWTASTENDLFPKLRATTKDSFSSMFFLKHNIHSSRSSGLVLFSFDRFGFIGFEYDSGKKIFQVELEK